MLSTRLVHPALVLSTLALHLCFPVGLLTRIVLNCSSVRVIDAFVVYSSVVDGCVVDGHVEDSHGFVGADEHHR